MPAAAEAAPGMLSIEGSFSYVEVKDPDGDVVVRRRPAKRPVRMLRHLRAGVYRVAANRRAARCARRVHVYSKGLTEVRVTPHVRRRCTMSRRALHARYPSRRGVRSVQRYLRARGGTVSWSVIDSWGREHGFAPHRTYVSASLVKAMLLTSYLRGIGNRMPDSSDRAVLGPMITVSSNDAADTIYYRVGDAALYRLAEAAGMRSFSIAGYWANAHFSAEDQARFFNRIDRLIPKRSRAYARGLLSSIVSYQRWGFSSFAGAAGFKTFFKGGWRGTVKRPIGARGGPVRARCHTLLHGGADRRQPVTRVRHRDAARSGGADVPCPPKRRHAGQTEDRSWVGRRPHAMRASWTCTSTDRASA